MSNLLRQKGTAEADIGEGVPWNMGPGWVTKMLLGHTSAILLATGTDSVGSVSGLAIALLAQGTCQCWAGAPIGQPQGVSARAD